MSPAEDWWCDPEDEEWEMLLTEQELIPPLTREQWHLTKWCDPCKLGDHHKCTGVDCYECRHTDHRFQGVKRLGNKDGWN